MKLLLALLLSSAAHAQNPWFFGNNQAVNLTPAIQYSNGVRNVTGALNPTSSAVNAPAGSLYMSTSTNTLYVKQDAGSTTNWLPLTPDGVGISSINSQTGPAITITSGTSGTDFAVATTSNTITLNLPTASASNRGALSSADWSTFNGKQAAGNYITALTGDVSASGPGSAAATIANLAVTNAKIANSTIDLTAKVTGVLPIANGGTNKALTLSAGGVVWTDADSFEVATAGTSGRLLVSGGTGAPTWSTIAAANIANIVGVTNPKTCLFQFGGSGSSTSPSQCTSSPCTEYQDTCSVVSSFVRGGTGNYNFAIATGTFANNTPVWYTANCTSGADALTVFWVSDLTSSGSGGDTVDIRTATNTTNTDSYCSITVTGAAP